MITNTSTTLEKLNASYIDWLRFFSWRWWVWVPRNVFHKRNIESWKDILAVILWVLMSICYPITGPILAFIAMKIQKRQIRWDMRFQRQVDDLHR